MGQGLLVKLQPHRAGVDRARLEGPVAHIAVGLRRKLHLRRRHEDVAIGLQPQALVGVVPGFLPPQAPGALREDRRAVLPRNHHPEADRDLRAHLQRQLDLRCRRQGHAGEGIPQPVLLHHHRQARIQRPFRKPELHLGVARHLSAEAFRVAGDFDPLIVETHDPGEAHHVAGRQIVVEQPVARLWHRRRAEPVTLVAPAHIHIGEEGLEPAPHPRRHPLSLGSRTPGGLIPAPAPYLLEVQGHVRMDPVTPHAQLHEAHRQTARRRRQALDAQVAVAEPQHPQHIQHGDLGIPQPVGLEQAGQLPLEAPHLGLAVASGQQHLGHVQPVPELRQRRTRRREPRRIDDPHRQHPWVEVIAHHVAVTVLEPLGLLLLEGQLHLGRAGRRREGAIDGLKLMAELLEIPEDRDVCPGEMAAQHNLLGPLVEHAFDLGLIEQVVQRLRQRRAILDGVLADEVDDLAVAQPRRPDHIELDRQQHIAALGLIFPLAVKADEDRRAEAPAGRCALAVGRDSPGRRLSHDGQRRRLPAGRQKAVQLDLVLRRDIRFDRRRQLPAFDCRGSRRGSPALDAGPLHQGTEHAVQVRKKRIEARPRRGGRLIDDQLHRRFRALFALEARPVLPGLDDAFEHRRFGVNCHTTWAPTSRLTPAEAIADLTADGRTPARISAAWWRYPPGRPVRGSTSPARCARCSPTPCRASRRQGPRWSRWRCGGSPPSGHAG